MEERCHKWASFLINHFPKESDFDWTGTLFYEWMIQEHPVRHQLRRSVRITKIPNFFRKYKRGARRELAYPQQLRLPLSS